MLSFLELEYHFESEDVQCLKFGFYNYDYFCIYDHI